jgi:hypothetical protein
VEADIFPSQIVSENVDDVGFVILGANYINCAKQCHARGEYVQQCFGLHVVSRFIF